MWHYKCSTCGTRRDSVANLKIRSGNFPPRCHVCQVNRR